MNHKNTINNALDVAKSTLTNTVQYLEQEIIRAAERIADALSRGSRVFFFGNGGSAADSQHLAAEFINRFKMERRPLPAIALTTDTSIITAVANDYDFNQIFAKQIQALAKPGDIAVGISTSGTSSNVIAGLRAARHIGAGTIAITGKNTSIVNELCDVVLDVPSKDTPRIQEAHIFMGHMICEIAEQIIFAGTEQR